MNEKVIFSPIEQDVKDHYRFHMKLTKMIPVSYFISIVMLVIGIFDFVKTKNYYYLVVSVFLIIVSSVFILYFLNGKARKDYEKMMRDDVFYSLERESVITETAIETKTLKRMPEPSRECIFPYTMMMGIFETEKAFYFYINSAEVRYLPKRAISPEGIVNITETLKKLANYKFVK